MAEDTTTLWGVTVQGPDDILAAPSYLGAIKIAQEFNRFWQRKVETRGQDENDPRMWASPIEWTYGAEDHAKELANPSPDYAAMIAAALNPPPPPEPSKPFMKG